MKSPRLIERIENNWEAIAAKVISQVRQDGHVLHYQALSEQELRDRAQDVVQNLRLWVLSENRQEVANRYEALGMRRFREGVPLHEVVYKLILLRRTISAFVAEQNLQLTPLEIYEELQLVRSLNRFFDHVITHTVKGYETALRRKLMQAGADEESEEVRLRLSA